MSDQHGLSDDLIWALRLVRLGTDEAGIVRALSKKHPKHGYQSLVFAEIVAARGREAACAYAVRTARKAAEFARKEPGVGSPYEARVRLDEIRGMVDVEPWPLELAGARRALEAAFLVAHERGRVAHFNLDLRTHAIRAGQSFAAIRKHRKTLHELGWLRRNPHDVGKRTSRFSFHTPNTCNRPSGVLICAGIILAHDAWRARALGDEGWYTHLLLRNRAASPEMEIAATSKLSNAGLLGLDDDNAILERLDLWALNAGTYNTGYTQGMEMLRQRAERAEVITCANDKRAAHAS